MHYRCCSFDEEACSRRWGEVIPLHFIPNITNMKTVILSYPSCRYSKAVEMIPELLALGSLYSILEKSKKKIIVVISGDLAHAHDPTGPYGYSETFEPFDKACGLWASTLQPDALLVTAASLVGQALSCGYTGFLTLQGILQVGETIGPLIIQIQ
uniref:Extradiol ring-cleavage dioxygenase class III enzyme subunit B domain-containing protein n=1 Tax=Biomphalaria glabrata TaxID=6526 RepID=A0A2C9M3Y6_BIOGL